METLLLQAVAKKLLNESLSPAEYERKLKELQTELFIKIKRAREDFIIKKKNVMK